MMSYDTYRYKVTIKDRGSVPVTAASKWQAIDIAYTQYSHVEPDRSKYTARKLK